MKRFLISISIFSILVIATITVGEYAVRQIPNPYSTKNRFILRHGDTVETLILGSSHTYYDIIPDSLSANAMSLANVSQNYEYDYRVLRHYSAAMPRLTTVIIPVSYFSLFDPPFDNSDEWWYEIYYRIYMYIDKYPQYSKYGFQVSEFPIFAGKIKAYITHKQSAGCSLRGFGLDFTLAAKDAGWKATAQSHALRHTANDAEYMPYNLLWLDSLLNYCNEIGATPIMITTPVCKEYRHYMNKTQRELTALSIDSISSSRDIKYYNFSDDSRFDDDDFYDADHLSDFGARRFTKILRDTLTR